MTYLRRVFIEVPNGDMRNSLVDTCAFSNEDLSFECDGIAWMRYALADERQVSCNAYATVTVIKMSGVE